jgi:protein-S-isoprenylcysteine O-methyltransferase Ste14
MNWVTTGFFLAATSLLAWISRASLRSPRTHGFYRFFAWEAILALAVLALPVWFLDPFAPHQLVSWALLIGSLYPLVVSLRLLRQRGKPGADRSGEALLGLEKTTALVTSGLYGLIRHPMYTSLLLLAWGVLFKQPSPAGLALALAASTLLYQTAKIEEAENLAFFGPSYTAYMRRTRMFIPFIF